MYKILVSCPGYVVRSSYMPVNAVCNKYMIISSFALEDMSEVVLCCDLAYAPLIGQVHHARCLAQSDTQCLLVSGLTRLCETQRRGPHHGCFADDLPHNDHPQSKHTYPLHDRPSKSTVASLVDNRTIGARLE